MSSRKALLAVVKPVLLSARASSGQLHGMQRIICKQAASLNLHGPCRALNLQRPGLQPLDQLQRLRSGILQRCFAATPDPVSVSEQAAGNQADTQSRQALALDSDASEPTVVQVTTITTEPPIPEDLIDQVAAKAASQEEGIGKAVSAAVEEAVAPAASALAAEIPSSSSTAASPAAPVDLAEVARNTPAKAVHSQHPSLRAFLENWSAFTASLAAQGYFKDEQFDLASTEVDMYGVIKRAILTLARERPDLLHSLPEQKLVLLIKQELPYEERKITNAKARLVASYLDKASLPAGSGGVASTQDFSRLLIGAYYSIRQVRKAEQMSEAPRLHQAGFLDAITAIMPDVMRLMASPADPAALAKADAVSKVKEQQAFTPAGTPANYPGRNVSGERSMGRQLSRQRSSADLKPGDWVCEVCNQHNFASRRECYRCSAEKPGLDMEMDAPRQQRRMAPPPVAGMGDGSSNMRPGDWECPECGNLNFSRRMECNLCSMPRPPETIPKGGLPQPPAFDDSRFSNRRTDFAPQGVKQGDWFCPDCNAHNFASRRQCFQCDSPRPAEAGGRPRAAPLPYDDRRYDNRRTDMAPAGARQGDWFCGDCGAHNFASRTECFQCSSPKSSGRSAAGSKPSFNRSQSSPRSSFERFQRIEPEAGDDWFNKG